ncbi:heterodisulfide reductase [Methanosarcinales archaeon]|nr:MAG: heterodisulfide reductase [Methanosarcinales archaeon]
MEEPRVIEVSKLNPNFKYEVAKAPGGEGILKCFACGTCTASCPVRAINDKYNPRRIIHMVLLGMREEVLNSEFIWLCATCYACQERCPQGVRITDIMCALQNIAAREGKVHNLYRNQLKALADFGRLYEIDDYDNKKRRKKELPELISTGEEITKLIEKTHLSKYLSEMMSKDKKEEE